MKTSARNQFHGKVTGVRAGAVTDEVELHFADGQSLVATITRTSRESLGLESGADAIALVKASSILLVTDGEGMRFSARNQLRGTVRSVRKGAVNCEVELELPGGTRAVAVVTKTSADALGLASDTAATALFKASSVVLACEG